MTKEELAMVTKEELRAYHDIKLEISVIEREIQSLYYPVSSVPMSSEGGHSSTPSNPTEAAVFKIDDKRRKLEAKQKELKEIIDKIDDWVSTLDDHLAASIIRLHFICGYTWKQTCKCIYGYADKDICRIAFNRFMEGQNGQQ